MRLELKLKRYNDGTKTYKIMFNFSAIQFNSQFTIPWFYDY